MGIRNTKTHVSGDWYTLVCDTLRPSKFVCPFDL